MIPKNISWALLFSVMEDLKAGRRPGSEHRSDAQSTEAASAPPFVEDYAASDTSLEQVFLSFAREANPDAAGASLNQPTSTGVLGRASHPEQPGDRSHGVVEGSEIPLPGSASNPCTSGSVPQVHYSSSIPNEQQLPMTAVNNSGDLLTDL